MEGIIGYETPIQCLRRLVQVDNSEEFIFLIKKKKQEVKLCTTLNKARIISSKIDDMYQIDPTIANYELQIPNIFLEIAKENSDERLDSITRAIEQILKSTTEKIRISNKEEEMIKYVLRLLGEKCDQIKMNSINEAISYLSTEFHSDSVKYISEHLLETINEGQIFHLCNTIIDEIIDSYFECKEIKEEEAINKEYKDIFDKLKKNGDPSIVIHFLLQIESHRYTKEMCEYITEHLSDEIVNCEEDQIVKQFVKHINFLKENENDKKESKIESISVEFKGDKLKGIISHLEEKFGENLCEQGEIKISDIGTHHHVYGSLANLIKYDSNHISDYYQNNGGQNPLPNSSEGWIEFDFLKRKVNLTSYTIRKGDDYYPKSWRIVGSNDRTKWEVLNQQINNSNFNYEWQHRFECENDHKYYQYIRYIQDESWSPNREHNIYLSCLEFFGSITM